MQNFQLTQIKRLVLASVALGLIGLAFWMIPPVFSAWNRQPAAIFEQVWQTVNQHFYDPGLNGVDWQAVKQKYQAPARAAESTAALAPVINQMLSELKTSHTHFYTQSEPAYYQLLGIFLPNANLEKQLKQVLPQGKIHYPGIGIFTTEIEGKVFIRAILDGSPAAQAGLAVGDQILAVAGQPYEPIQAFVGQVGEPVQLSIQRRPDAELIAIAVTPKLFDPQTMFLEAMQASTEVIQRQGKQLGYLHIWSYAGDRYQEQLENELIHRQLKQVDGLILDLREGWGGASPSYLNLFTAKIPTMTVVGRDRQPRKIDYQWKKPVVMVVNQGARSGKEILAYGFQKYKIGPIVGTKTAGAVVAGRPYLMKDGSMLYLAVANVFVDGERLEGRSVNPDVEVAFQLPYAQGADPFKEQAIATLLTLLNSP